MANTTNPTTPAPTTPTTVTITQANRTQFTVDLHNLSAAKADELYAALGRTGTDFKYQQLADQVADFAHNFKSIVSVGLPSGMNYQTAMNNFMNMLKANGGTITEGSDQYLKDLQKSALGQSIIQSGIYRTAAGTAAVFDAGSEFLNGMASVPRAISAMTSAATGTAADYYGQIGFGMSNSQAKAIGTAYAAALYSKVDAPGVQSQPNIIQKGIAYIESAASNIWHLLPASMTAYLGAAIKWMTNGYHWDVAYNEAFAEATAARNAPALTYEQTLQRNMVASADRSSRPEAAAMLRQAGTIAGMATGPIADVVEQGGVYRHTNGTYRTLTFEGGKPVTTDLNNPAGQPLTIEQRRTDRVAAVMEALPNSPVGFMGMTTGIAGVWALETSRVAPLRGAWNAVVHVAMAPIKLATNMTLGTISAVDRAFAGVVNTVLPSSAGIRAHDMQDANAINRAGDVAERRATRRGNSQGLTGEALEQAAKEAAEAARARAEAALKPRGVVSRAFDFLRPVGDSFHATGVQITENMTGFRNWINGGITDVKQLFLFDRRTAERKIADAAKAEADRAVEIALANTRNAAQPAATTAAETVARTEPVVASTAAQTAQTAARAPLVEPAPVPHRTQLMAGTALQSGADIAGAAVRTETTAARTVETAGIIARGATTVAEGATKAGPWGKLIALGAVLFGAGAAGVAEAHDFEANPDAHRGESKVGAVAGAFGNGLWETGGGIVGAPDFVRGDTVRGAAALASLIPMVPGVAIVDTFRQVDAVDKVPLAQVAQLNSAINANAPHTGNVYLDRVIALKAMQARGVKEVAMAPLTNFNPLWSSDNMGEVAYEGPAVVNYGAAFLEVPAASETTASVQQAIDLNLRLFVVKGGNLVKAQTALGAQVEPAIAPAGRVAPTAPALAEPAPSAPVAQTTPAPLQTSALSNEQLLAGHADVIQQARMSVNRVAANATRPTALNLGSSFASVDSTRAAIATRTPGTGGGQQPDQQAMIA